MMVETGLTIEEWSSIFVAGVGVVVIGWAGRLIIRLLR